MIKLSKLRKKSFDRLESREFELSLTSSFAAVDANLAHKVDFRFELAIDFKSRCLDCRSMLTATIQFSESFLSMIETIMRKVDSIVSFVDRVYYAKSELNSLLKDQRFFILANAEKISLERETNENRKNLACLFENIYFINIWRSSCLQTTSNVKSLHHEWLSSVQIARAHLQVLTNFVNQATYLRDAI